MTAGAGTDVHDEGRATTQTTQVRGSLGAGVKVMVPTVTSSVLMSQRQVLEADSGAEEAKRSASELAQGQGGGGGGSAAAGPVLYTDEKLIEALRVWAVGRDAHIMDSQLLPILDVSDKTVVRDLPCLVLGRFDVSGVGSSVTAEVSGLFAVNNLTVNKICHVVMYTPGNKFLAGVGSKLDLQALLVDVSKHKPNWLQGVKKKGIGGGEGDWRVMYVYYKTRWRVVIVRFDDQGRVDNRGKDSPGIAEVRCLCRAGARIHGGIVLM